jgi:hypothetical protein
MPKTATPTIREVLAEFLADQEGKVSDATLRRYRSGIDLFATCMDNYGVLDDKNDRRLFCDAAGPDQIPSLTEEFLGWFLVRKVIAGKVFLKSCGTAVKVLGAWLQEKGYIDADDAIEMGAKGKKAAKDLPKADALRDLLDSVSEGVATGETEEGHFRIVGVEKGGIVVMAQTGEEMRVVLRQDVTEQCVVGWSFSGVLGKRRTTWNLVEVWNVYP